MTIQSEIKNQISNLERTVDIRFPNLYVDFLEKIPKDEIYEIDNTGICFYSYSDLIERNETYEIKEYDSNYFMIGQEGDKGFFINAKDSTDETIYSNGLGAIGSLTMKKEADSIFELEKKFLYERDEENKEEIDDKVKGRIIITDIGKDKMKVINYLKSKLKLTPQQAIALSKQVEIDFLEDYSVHLESTINYLESLGATAVFRPD